MELSDKKFAVLIDADNISHRKIKDILDEIANYGTPTIKRIYGDFTDPKFAAWKSVLLENSITPIQQYAYTTGKNATDSALIIDAMDILHKESVNGFCIVSSDSDYTWRAASANRDGKYSVSGRRRPPSRSSNRATNSSMSRYSGSPHPPRLRYRHRHKQRQLCQQPKLRRRKKPRKNIRGAMHPKQTCRRQPPQNPPLRRKR